LRSQREISGDLLGEVKRRLGIRINLTRGKGFAPSGDAKPGAFLSSGRFDHLRGERHDLRKIF
jgi:hypothetical protein